MSVLLSVYVRARDRCEVNRSYPCTQLACFLSICAGGSEPARNRTLESGCRFLARSLGFSSVFVYRIPGEIYIVAHFQLNPGHIKEYFPARIYGYLPP